MDISEDQYNNLKEYIDRSIENPPPYSLFFGAQCTGWALAGLVEAEILPEGNAPDIEPSNIFLDFYESLIWNPFNQVVNVSVYNFFQSALNWFPRRDPLVLDLDGDGIETLPANGTVLFDHDGDGLKNATGWIKSDDGLLVLDRNGNGLIDNGSELFGDNTTKADGTKAKNGFDALTDFDSNQDGQVDASDAQFGNLRVWRDLNADGTSQASELFTLNQLGIKSIGTGSTPSSAGVGNNNVEVAKGHFTYVNGAEGEVEAAASLNLAENNFYREFTDHLPVAADKAGLPNMQGSGAVRDLREAAASNANLENILNQYAQATTREAQFALVDDLLKAWADSADYLDWEERIDTQTYAYATNDGGFNGGIKQYRFEFSWSNEDVSSGYSTSGGDLDGDGKLSFSDVAGLTPEEEAALAKSADVLRRVKVLEVFNAQDFFKLGQSVEEVEAAIEQNSAVKDAISFQIGSTFSSHSMSGAAFMNAVVIVLHVGDLALSQPQADLVNRSYDQLRQSVYDALLLQTRLKPYMDAVSLTVSDSGEFVLDFTALDSLVQSRCAVSSIDALVDVIELQKATHGSLMDAGWVAGYEFIYTTLNSLSAEEQSSLFSRYGKVTSTSSDLIFTESHQDSIWADAGNDFVFAGNGSQTISGRDGTDFLSGGNGDDQVYGDAGDDILIGGSGNDYLSGGEGKNIYIFQSGDDQDIVLDYDAVAGAPDRIVFGEGISLVDLSFARLAFDLVVRIGTQGDQIRISNYFNGELYRIEELEVGGEVLSLATVLSQRPVEMMGATEAGDTIYGTNQNNYGDGLGGNDGLYGYDGDDTLLGGAGADGLFGGNDNDYLDGGADNDYVSGDAGDDILIGGAGNDTLLGDIGSDNLTGGLGNDTLQGGAGTDTYNFSVGDGQDVITDYDTDANNSDTALLAGADSDDLWFARSGNHLIVSRIGTADQVTIQNWYSSAAYQVESIETDTGTLASTAVNQLVTAMAQFNVSVGVGQVVPQNVWDQLQPTLAEVWQPRAGA